MCNLNDNFVKVEKYIVEYRKKNINKRKLNMNIIFCIYFFKYYVSYIVEFGECFVFVSL